MRGQDRTEIYEEVTIPAHLTWRFIELAPYRPPLNRLSDAELAKLPNIPEARVEEERRRHFVEEAVKDGRVRYVRLLTNPRNDASLWWSLSKFDQDPWGSGHQSHGRMLRDALWYAKHVLSNRDEGGVIFVEGRPDGFSWEKENQTLYVWESECSALRETGNHDFVYNGIGDDVCRACGLVV